MLVHVLVYALVDVTGETGQARSAKPVQETKLSSYYMVLVGKASKRVKQIGRHLDLFKKLLFRYLQSFVFVSLVSSSSLKIKNYLTP